MLSALYALAGAVLAYGALSYFNGLRYRIAAARRSGLPYLVTRKSPTHLCGLGKLYLLLIHMLAISPLSHYWLLTFKIWTPLIKTLPKSWWESWIE